MKPTDEFLHHVPLFQKLSDDELAMVRGVGSIRKVEKDRVIFLEGEPFAGFYVVLQGSIKIYKLSFDGDETILHILKQYKSFAETPMFTNSNVYPACAQAIEDSTLFHIPKVEFKRLMEDSSSLAIKISETFAVRLMELNKKFGQLSLSVGGKVARYMIAEIDSNGAVKKAEPFFVLAISKKDLAAQLGIAVETLSRTLRKLKDQKIIRESSKRIFVLDMKRLRELSL